MKQEENVCAKCACFRVKGLRCKNQPLGITHPETESCSRFKERCCGNCCWFYGETSYGFGFCACDSAPGEYCHCSDVCAKNHISRKEMRHHMAVLLQYHRADEDMNYVFPGGEALEEAVVFAYKYMKVFSKL